MELCIGNVFLGLYCRSNGSLNCLFYLLNKSTNLWATGLAYGWSLLLYFVLFFIIEASLTNWQMHHLGKKRRVEGRFTTSPMYQTLPQARWYEDCRTSSLPSELTYKWCVNDVSVWSLLNIPCMWRLTNDHAHIIIYLLLIEILFVDTCSQASRQQPVEIYQAMWPLWIWIPSKVHSTFSWAFLTTWPATSKTIKNDTTVAIRCFPLNIRSSSWSIPNEGVLHHANSDSYLFCQSAYSIRTTPKAYKF